MSKTLGSILTFAGTAALVATGVGAAAGLALFGTTAGISVAGAGLGTLLTVSTALAAAGSLISSLDTPNIRPQQTEGAIKHPTPPRVSGYGKARLPFRATLP